MKVVCFEIYKMYIKNNINIVLTGCPTPSPTVVYMFLNKKF